LAGHLSEHWVLAICCASGETGLATIAHLRRKLGAATVIIAIGPHQGSLPVAELFLNGASEYLVKPLRAKDVRRKLRAVQEQCQICSEESFSGADLIQPELVVPALESPLIGQAPPLLAVFKQLAGILAAEAQYSENATFRPTTFFLTGETGTGKELFARLIHRRSRFGQGPFVAVNCATLPRELAEAELFGHEAGAFTGAQRTRRGLWEQADGGTLFLDELTEAPPSLLPKLLRVLQDGQVKRLGSSRIARTRVQVIAASNRDLAGEIAAGRMRRDLYHRFLHHLHLPPLRERREDIPLLVRHFAQRYALCPVQFSVEAMALLHDYAWPGNVRELENVIRLAVTQTVEGRITAAALEMRLRRPAGDKDGLGAANFGGPAMTLLTAPWEERVKGFKLQTIQETLAAHRGNVTRAAAALGLTRAALYKIRRGLSSNSPPA
jgi:DNA-binding NtrC family response regulator